MSKFIIILISSFILLMIIFIFYPLIYPKEVVTLYNNSEPTKIRPKFNEVNSTHLQESSIYDTIAGRTNTNIIPYSVSEPEKPLVLNNNSLIPKNIEDIFSQINDPIIDNDELTNNSASISKNNGLIIVKIDKNISNINNLTDKNKNEHFYRVQLASVKDKESGVILWNNFKHKYPEILSGLDLVLKKIDQSNGKFYFLVLAGKYKNMVEAKNVCMKLIPQKQHCIIYKD